MVEQTRESTVLGFDDSRADRILGGLPSALHCTEWVEAGLVHAKDVQQLANTVCKRLRVPWGDEISALERRLLPVPHWHSEWP